MASNYQYTNNAATTLASSITSVATSLTVVSGTGAIFPTLTGANFFFCTLQNTAGTVVEIVKVTARSSDTFTIVRAQESTTASGFNAGDKVELRLTAGEINQIFSGVVQGGNTDQIFVENGQTVTANYSITSNKSAHSSGPVTTNTGITVTVPSGSRWIIL